MPHYDGGEISPDAPPTFAEPIARRQARQMKKQIWRGAGDILLANDAGGAIFRARPAARRGNYARIGESASA